jgi:hypothetical protein
MSRKEQNIWLPNGYGRGTIIKALDYTYYQATSPVGMANIYNVIPVEEEFALLQIKNGAPALNGSEK